MLVNRQETGAAGAGGYNRAFGLDAGVTLFQDLIFSAYLARTDEDDPVGDDPNVAMVQAAWRGTSLDVSGLFKHVGDGFNPEAGFVDRTSVRRYFATAGVHPRVSGLGLREVNPYLDVDLYTNLGGALESRRVQAGTILTFLDGASLNLGLSSRYERLFDDTSIAGVDVGPGEYDWVEPSLSLTAPGSRAISGSVSLRWGDFYDGSRTSISGKVTFRPNEHLSFDAQAQHNDLELGGSSFTADLFSGRLRYAHDTRTFFMAFVQYNEAADELIVNTRFNLIHAPLSDLFLVYTERRTLAGTVASSILERGLTLKVTKLLAF
jgi:hypothetical protein